MGNPCIFTLKDGRTLNYDQMREYIFENYKDLEGAGPAPEEKPRDRSKKAILNRLYESDNIAETAKEKFREKGLTYEPQSKEESRRIAGQIVDTFGIDEAVSLAEARRFGGGINSSIFAQALDRTYALEKSDAQNASKHQEAWADIAVRYDEWARGLGRDIAQIDDFYRRSPIGVILAEQKKRDIEFEQFMSDKEEGYEDMYEDMQDDPDFIKLENIGKTAPSKAKKAEYRNVRRKNIVDFFDQFKTNKDITMATIIPPSVWNGSVEAMKQAALAGESVYAIMEAGIEYITKKVGKFDEDKFRQYWEGKIKQAEQKGKPAPEAQQGTLFPGEEVTPEMIAAEKILDKYREKMAGMTDKEKRNFVRKLAKSIIENGGLEYAEFRDILADVIGKGEISIKMRNEIEAFVNDLNAVDPAKQKAIADKTTESLNEYRKAFDKAQKSAIKLSNIIKQEADPVRTLQALIQLNTLTFVSLTKNVAYNYWWQILGRFPRAVTMSAIDHVIYGAGKVLGKNIPVDYTILNVQEKYFKKMLEGFSVGGKQLITGLSNLDYFQKEIKANHLRPFESVKDLWDWGAKGEIRLSSKEVSDKLLQSTFGVPAEVVARILNMGDKGFRWSAEGGQAVREGAKFGFKGIDMELFIAFPKEMAKDYYLKKGLTESEAEAEAEATEKRIITEGEEAVFQQENIVNKFFKALGDAYNNLSKDNAYLKASNTFRKIIGVLSMPYVKTPLNLAYHIMALASPELSILTSMIMGRRAYLLKKNGDPMWKNEYLQSKKWLATAAVGLGYVTLYSWLKNINAISGGGEKEEKEKERAAQRLYKQPRSINTSKVARVLTGGSPENQDGDLTIDLSWFGATGNIMAIMENKTAKDLVMTEEEKTILYDLLSRLDLASYEALEKGVFSTQSALIQAYLDRNNSFFQQYLTNLFDVGLNVVQTGTFAQYSRAKVPYYYQIKADTFVERLENSMAARSENYRRWFNKYPPVAYTIWGDRAERKDPWYFYMFGVNKIDKDAFAIPIFELYEKTANAKYLPPVPKNVITYEGKDIELDTKQYEEYFKFVGEERKKLVAPFINGFSKMYVADQYGMVDPTPKKFSELSDESKLEKLEKIYSIGQEQGKQNFINYAATKYPKLFPVINQEKKAMDDLINNLNNMQTQQEKIQAATEMPMEGY